MISLPDETLTELCGEPRRSESLRGMSGAHVQRVMGPRGSVVVKGPASQRESLFYSLNLHAIAPIARRITDTWLVLEDVPRALPRERWGADAEVVSQLRKLHALPTQDHPDLYRPRWDAELDGQALSMLPVDDRRDLERPIADLRRASQHLFIPRHFISGDPNPTNWRLRVAGPPILVDWGRFGLGTAALDLGILVQSLAPSAKAIYETLASLSGVPLRDIHTAHIWSILDFLAMTARGEIAPPSETLDLLRSGVGPWLRRLTAPVPTAR